MADIDSTCEIDVSLQSAQTSDGNRWVYLQVVRDPANTDVWDEVASPFEVVKQINR
jgi:hypothetical protein